MGLGVIRAGCRPGAAARRAPCRRPSARSTAGRGRDRRPAPAAAARWPARARARRRRSVFWRRKRSASVSRAGGSWARARRPSGQPRVAPGTSPVRSSHWASCTHRTARRRIDLDRVAKLGDGVLELALAGREAGRRRSGSTRRRSGRGPASASPARSAGASTIGRRRPKGSGGTAGDPSAIPIVAQARAVHEADAGCLRTHESPLPDGRESARTVGPWPSCRRASKSLVRSRRSEGGERGIGHRRDRGFDQAGSPPGRAALGPRAGRAERRRARSRGGRGRGRTAARSTARTEPGLQSAVSTESPERSVSSWSHGELSTVDVQHAQPEPRPAASGARLGADHAAPVPRIALLRACGSRKLGHAPRPAGPDTCTGLDRADAPMMAS